MNNNKLTLWIVIGLVVGIGIIVAAVLGLQGKTGTPAPGTVTPGTTQALPGTSGVTEKGVVVTPEGKPAENDAPPGAPEAPKQSNPVSESALPPETLKLTVSSAGFVPNAFAVKAGQALTLGLTATDDQTHVFMFDDPSLSAVAIGVAPGETRAITFNAPEKKGTYSFRCDVPGHKARGEVGVMTVQ